MTPDEPPQNLEDLLQRLEQVGEADQPVTIESMLQVTDERSFGALLLIPGLLVLSPLSGIPGLPSVVAVMVALIAIQLLIGRTRFWLPQWLLRRSTSRSKYDKAMAFLHRIAGVVDRLLKRRLTFLTIAGAGLSVLGLGMMARDGAMVVVALLFFFGLAYMTARLWL